jgi:hypothetical protein
MKYLIFFLLFNVHFFYAQSNVSFKYKITEVGVLDDGSYYFKIENENEKAIIVETNYSLEITNCTKIQKGKSYYLSLEKIERNFRGKNDKYVLISENGTQTTIWDKKDNYPLLLYKAININGLCLVEKK